MSAEKPAHASVTGHHDEAVLDEPQTPTWLTLLGVALFFVVMLLFLASRPDGKTAEELTRQSKTAAPSPQPSAPLAPAP